jgi:hypothetical protein
MCNLYFNIQYQNCNTSWLLLMMLKIQAIYLYKFQHIIWYLIYKNSLNGILVNLLWTTLPTCFSFLVHVYIHSIVMIMYRNMFTLQKWWKLNSCSLLQFLWLTTTFNTNGKANLATKVYREHRNRAPHNLSLTRSQWVVRPMLQVGRLASSHDP